MAALVGLGILVLVAFGLYFFIRTQLGKSKKRQDSWALAAEQLGSTVDTERSGAYKPILGEQNGFRFEVSHFGANPRTSGGTVKFDDCVEVKVFYLQPLRFSLDLTKPEMLYEKVGAYLDSSDSRIGHEVFDSTFTISCSDIEALVPLLYVEITGGETANLLEDLLRVAQDHLRVKVTDTSITLGNMAAFADADQIRPIIDRAVGLAGRIAAGQKLARS